jgi:DM4/DM12 family
MNRLDDFMAQHNIDSNACMQKAVCHFVRSADYHSSVGTADQIESMVSSISENSIIDYMLDGTAIKDAIENGKNPTGRDCDSIYPACPLDRQSALQMMKKFLPLPGRTQTN